MKIIIIGNGGQARSCLDVISTIKKFEFCGFVSKLKRDNVIGADKDLKELRKKFSIQGSRGLYASVRTLIPNIQRLSIASTTSQISQKDLRHTRRTILDPLPVLIEMTQIHVLACFFWALSNGG